MGRRGPRPTPTSVLTLRGSSLLPQRVDEPKGTDGPALLLPFVVADERARWYFDRLIEDLRRLGVYAAEDYAAHNRWAALMAEMERADAEVRQTGLVVETAQGKWQNPMKKVRDDAWAEASKLGREFGLTPASRVGLVSSRKQQQGDASGIDALLKPKFA
jgi:P27 family predicted phage terminase small subunit